MATNEEKHRIICQTLFSDLKKYVRLHSLEKDTGYTWRTIRHHIILMSIGYKERHKLGVKTDDNTTTRQMA